MYSPFRNPHPVDLSDFFPVSDQSQESHLPQKDNRRKDEGSEFTRVVLAGFSQLQTRVSDGLFSIELNNIKF